uniref:Uncharacterized protein n=1 Tax=Rhipicephalus pulchellus TaxID=72859 RepID=L7M5A7_RHIPC
MLFSWWLRRSPCRVGGRCCGLSPTTLAYWPAASKAVSAFLLGKAWWCCHTWLPSTPSATFCNRNKSVPPLRTLKVSQQGGAMFSHPDRPGGDWQEAGGVCARDVNGETRVVKPTNTVVTCTAQYPLRESPPPAEAVLANDVLGTSRGGRDKRCGYEGHTSSLAQVAPLVGIFTRWAAVPVGASGCRSAVARVRAWLHPPARAPLRLTHWRLLWPLAMTRVPKTWLRSLLGLLRCSLRRCSAFGHGRHFRIGQLATSLFSNCCSLLRHSIGHRLCGCCCSWCWYCWCGWCCSGSSRS